MQGLEPCPGCRNICYQCGKKGIRAGQDAAHAWDIGELFALSDPTRLPSPTTNSLARTVIMHPERGSITRLHIWDAERAQGMKVGHTCVTLGEVTASSQKSFLKLRFRFVGNAVTGMRQPQCLNLQCVTYIII
jgi:hypothetical protein